MKQKKRISRPDMAAATGVRIPLSLLVSVGVSAAVCATPLQAGDILRGGAAPRNPTANAPSDTAPASGAGTSAPNPNDALARTARAMQDVRLMQEAARAAAQAAGGSPRPNPNQPDAILPHVPDGLAPGGLQPASGIGENPALWSGADLPTERVVQEGVKVNVRQTASQALLTWQSFNIGKNTQLHFDQSLGGTEQANWIVFNKVKDPTGVPSQILGSMTAPGQVYVINPNGIIFGGASQINLRALTASSLPINTNLVESGLLNNPDAQFLFSALDLPAGPNGTPQFRPEALPEGLTRPGDVLVEAGALIEAATSAEGIGGRVMLAGPNVTNSGTIATPDGQTILAAGLQVGVAAHASDDPSLRGLDVYVGAVSAPGLPAGASIGTATNDGLIEVPRGNLTMAGKSVDQLGAIHSSTSVDLNGRIDLVASYGAVSNPATGAGAEAAGARPFLFRNSGLVRFGDGSMLRILPEVESDRKVVGTELALRSMVNITGQSIYMGEEATLFAPNALVNLNAGEWRYRTLPLPVSDFVHSSGQVYLDRNALIDVSGTSGVKTPVSQHFLAVDLRGAELADSPLQRQGALRGQTIIVDSRQAGEYNGHEWIGTPLANVAGYANLIERSVGELTVDGGTVNIQAGDAIVISEGSAVDVSGGWIDFEASPVAASRLLSGGRVIDISEARPDVVYQGIYSGKAESVHARWGVSQSFDLPLAPVGAPVEPGYRQGANGGALNLSASSMALDGNLVGATVTGERQREAQPRHASLSLSFTKQDGAISPVFPVVSPVPPTIVLQTTSSLAPAGPFILGEDGLPVGLGADRMETVEFSTDLLAPGNFGRLTIFNPDGDILLPEGEYIQGPVGGEIDLRGSNIHIDGRIILPSGEVTLGAANTSLGQLNALELATSKVNPEPNPGRGRIVLGETAVIDVAGRTVDERPGFGEPSTSPIANHGGSVSIRGFDTFIREGSRIDASGGVHGKESGKIAMGAGGTITIEAGRDLNLPSVLGGQLLFEGEMTALSGSQGGTLRLLAPAVQIGGDEAASGILHLQPEFFDRGGFGSFDIRGIGAVAPGIENYVPGLVILSGTTLSPVQESWTAPLDKRLVLRPTILPDGLRRPVNLAFGSVGANDPFASTLLVRGDTILEEGARLDLDPRATVSFTGDTVSIHGAVVAPGGAINISGAPAFPAVSPDLQKALPTVHLGSTAHLSTAGRTVLTENPLNLRLGDVLGGGRIAVTGNILAENGAMLDVSGASGVLDLPVDAVAGAKGSSGSLQGRHYVPTEVFSRGGEILLSGNSLLLSDATLRGQGGGEGASGGSLVVGSGRFYQDAEIRTTADITLKVSQDDPAFASTAELGIGKGVYDSTGAVISGGGRFAVDRFMESGLDHLELRGNVLFDGPVSLEAEGSLRIASGGVVEANDRVDLQAAYVLVGKAFVPPMEPGQQPILFTQDIPGVGQREFYFDPTHGTGLFNITGRHIDVGSLSLQGIGAARLFAPNGDVRGNGYLNMAGDLLIEAGQVHPTTAGHFTITSSDYEASGENRPGTISILNAGGSPLPWSAGGDLRLYATEISQGGTLRAPMGTIQLGWDGSGASPVNPISNRAAPVASTVKLAPGSLTSVSAVPAEGGDGLVLPFGLVGNGGSWIDPRGVDVTVSGPPVKAVQISAKEVDVEAEAVIDLRGGGDLYAYTWQPGAGGSRDILGESAGFAIVPSYEGQVAPYAPFNPAPTSGNLGSDRGYSAENLKVGDRIYLKGSEKLAEGYYTLLPARYALLPGGLLVTPRSGAPTASETLPDGSIVVAGHRLSGWNETSLGRPLTSFTLLPGEVVRERSEYADFYANESFAKGAETRGVPAPRLPVDAGQVVLSATREMNLRGAVLAAAAAENGRGSQVDINSPLDILIGTSGVSPAENRLFLDAANLSSFGVDSLLIGGVRKQVDGLTTVQVGAGSIVLDNEGSPLSAPDIILVANQSITLAENSALKATGDATGSTDHLHFGDSDVAASGDGVLVRVSSAQEVAVDRSGVSGSTAPKLVIEAAAEIAGVSLILDSSNATFLDPEAILASQNVDFRSGHIGLVIGDADGPAEAPGLVLSGAALDSILESAESLGLLSYSTIDLFGEGRLGSATFEKLALRADAIRGFDSGTEGVEFVARHILLGNGGKDGSVLPPATGELNGRIGFTAEKVELGNNVLAVEHFAEVALSASEEVRLGGSGGLDVQGNLLVETPVITSSTGARQSIRAGGDLHVTSPAAAGTGEIESGLGGSLILEGASVTLDSDIYLPSGSLVARAVDGDLIVGSTGSARLDVAGQAHTFFDKVRYTDAGTIELAAERGSVRVEEGASLDLSAKAGGGRAGLLTVSVPKGSFVLDGTLDGTGGDGGSFQLDTVAMEGNSLAILDEALNAGGFLLSRDLRVRTGDVRIDGAVKSHAYALSADAGSIRVAGEIDASGITGGEVALRAAGDLILESGSHVTVAAEKFDNAGKGGSVLLEAGAPTNGLQNADAWLEIREGSTIDLSVAEKTASSENRGHFSGVLHLRAPRNDEGSDLRVGAIGGALNDPSHVTVEGVKVYDLTGTDGLIDAGVQNTVRNDAITFLGSAGGTSAGYQSMFDRLTSANPDLRDSLVIIPGAEIVNQNGNLSLGTATSTSTSDWNLAGYRFGPLAAPGALTLRASGDLLFFNALSDGFSGGSSLWLSPLMGYNPLLPANAQSWSYRLVAGSDTGASDPARVRPGSGGSLHLGKNAGAAVAQGGNNATTASIIGERFQVIRTGSDDIDIHTAGNVRLLNPFASIYTAGTAVSQPTTLHTENDFSLPVLSRPGPAISQGALGAAQQNYPVQYSMAGGDVRIHAGENIERFTRDGSGNLVPDSSRQLPNNWLYRRGLVGTTGEFGQTLLGGGFGALTDPFSSTTWWVDFSNFFQGVGALGGGNVSLLAGRDVANVDAVIPTNARMPQGVPDAAKLVELGGGDLLVQAGRNIDGGVYYVERGTGTLLAGNSLTTNSTRSPSLGIVSSFSNPALQPSLTWLPTTLFLGKGHFDVAAKGDLLLGPVTNPFFLPQGLNNRFWFKTYFSTFAPESSVNVASLTGDVTLRHAVTSSETTVAQPILQIWLQRQNLLTMGSAALFQPWLRLAETSVDPFSTMATLLPPALQATTFVGDINLVGNMNLFPSRSGALELLSAGAVNALQPTGRTNRIVGGSMVDAWSTARINVSDADPDRFPGVASPFAYMSLVGNAVNSNNQTQTGFLQPMNRIFAETGATNSVLQTKQALHAPGLLHRDDHSPLAIYAAGGDISGLNLFSPKVSRIVASRDITDIDFYIQNVRQSDVSLVAAGRDIVAYHPNSALRNEAVSPGNAFNLGQQPRGGDIQVSGPGAIEVMAGRHLDLGVGPSHADGTARGLASVGNARNPFLPARGADIVAGAGIGPSLGLAESRVSLQAFIDAFINPSAGARSERYLAELDKRLGGDGDAWSRFQSLPEGERNRVALSLFYAVLRDTGRDFNDPESPGFGNYEHGLAAVKTLFPGTDWSGDILLPFKQIVTTAGGDISLLAPGGDLVVGFNSSEAGPDQGILTQAGGNISIFTDGSVLVGTSRIFTLRGGNMVIWSSNGDIAAGSAAKTVQSAPPTRVIVNAQTAAVETDLAGLATGGGIGVLQTVAGVEPGDVDLIAPTGTIDAGDAGIRVAGKLNIAAVQVLNAGNIQTGGSASGVPVAPAAGANAGSLTAAAGAAGAATSAADQASRRQGGSAPAEELAPSIVTVEVIGFGNSEEEEPERSL